MLLSAAPLLELDLTTAPSAPGVARDQITTVLRDRVDEHVLDRSVLLVSELVTNAVTHARTSVRLRVWIDEGLVRVEVHNRAAVASRLQRAATLGAGRVCGLRLVDTLATRRGVQGDRSGKSVWLELSLSTTCRPR